MNELSSTSQDSAAVGAPPGGGLRDSEHQFRMLVQGVTDYAIYMLDPQGGIVSWNAGGERIKGYKADEIIGRHFSCFYTEEERASGEPERALRAAREQGKYAKEGWRVRKDGTYFWASVVIDPVHDDDGQLVGFAKITRDVTERRQAEEALDLARQSMLQAQKAQAVGQLTYGVAHDFNNLLTVITNSLDLIALDSSDPKRVRRLVAAAQRAAQRGATLTQQLLAFSRRQTLNPEPRHLNALVTSMEALLRRVVGEDVRFVLDLAPGLPQCDVDEGEFEAAMLNLVANARDAMPNGGSITIRTRTRQAEAGELGDAPAGRYVAVSVLDTGEGMPPEVLARATEPFFTTKDVGRGSGLGLSQVSGLAAQLGGHAGIESEPGLGTRVTLFLPVSQGSAEASPEGTAASSRLLLVDDDADVQVVVFEALRYLGYSVMTAGDGTAALEILRREPEIALLLTDVVMPGMSGVELAQQARALWPQLKVIFASGYTRGELPTIPEGCDFIAKPYRIDALRERLDRVLAPLPA